MCNRYQMPYRRQVSPSMLITSKASTKNFNQTSASPLNWKFKILAKPGFRISTKIQLHNLNQTSAAKYWPNFRFQIPHELQLQSSTNQHLVSQWVYQLVTRVANVVLGSDKNTDQQYMRVMFWRYQFSQRSPWTSRLSFKTLTFQQWSVSSPPLTFCQRVFTKSSLHQYKFDDSKSINSTLLLVRAIELGIILL